ncbi:MAG: hypothetical protein QXH80_00470 [Candidatus Nanoarchaeia archaeon]
MKTFLSFSMLFFSLALFAEQIDNGKIKTFKFKINAGSVILALVGQYDGNLSSDMLPIYKNAYSINIKNIPTLSLNITSPIENSKKGLAYKIIFREDCICREANYKIKRYNEVPSEYLVKDSFMEEIRAPDFEMLAERDEKQDITVYTIPIVVVKDNVHVLKLYFAKDLTVLKSAVNLPKGAEDYLGSVMFSK